MSKCSKIAMKDGKNLNKRGGKNVMKKLQSKNGITLIALVITIIVLLLLAGVTIATLTGDNRNIKPSTKGTREFRGCKV